MRTKLLSALLLASTAITGVASASPYVRDHRYPQQQQQRRDRDHDRDDVRPSITYKSTYRPAPSWSWSGGVQVSTQPSWMPQVNYGYQLDADGDEATPYAYGQDPYVEGIARGEWTTLNPSIDLNGHQAVRTTLNRPVQSIEFQATQGGAYVYTVGVGFADGSQRAFQVQRVLDASHEPNLRIDLGAEGLRGVEAVVFDARGAANIRMIGA